MYKRYKNILAGLKKKPKARRAKKDWCVYIVRCSDGTLYTGTSNDVDRRIGMHNKGTGARYTRTRGPVVLVYQENSMTRSQALVREAAIKTIPKPRKEKLIANASL